MFWKKKVYKYAYVDLYVQTESEAEPQRLIYREFSKINHDRLEGYAMALAQGVMEGLLHTESENFVVTLIVSDGILEIERFNYLGRV